jgi:hypothetical protein
MILNPQLKIAHFDESTGGFVRTSVTDLFKVGEQNLLVTYGIGGTGAHWEVTEIFRVGHPEELRLIYRYSPSGYVTLDHFLRDANSESPHVQETWAGGILKCWSSLEWRKRSKHHTPDLSLNSKARLELGIKSLVPAEMKKLNALAKRKFGMGFAQELSAVIDRISFDGDAPNFFVSSGVAYGDDPPFGKSPCPSGWNKKNDIPKIMTE